MALLMKDGSTNQQITSFELNTKQVNPLFILRQARNAEGWLASTASSATIPILDTGIISRLSLSLPPLPEQRAIVAFLDRADRRIRRYIRAKEKLIGLLEEQKKALIHQAVTGQIDARTGQPYPAYKPSGVEWLGEVPAHWEVVPFKYNYKVSMGQTILATDLIDDGEFPVISATEENHYFGRISSPRFTLERGDLVIPARGVSIGAVKRVVEPSVCTQTTIYAKQYSLRKLDSTYVYFFLSGCRTWLFEYDRTAIPQLTVKQVQDNPTLLPPLPEQRAIVAFLDKATSDIDTATAQARRQVALLREYRTRLIADVVTGKLDVRGNAT